MSWLHAANTTLLGKALRLPLRLIPANTVVSVRRGLTAGMKWRVGASTHGCWLGTYEHAAHAVIRELVRPGMIVFDIGANAGYYTLAFSMLCGHGHVYAFEPNGENVENLLAHVRLNGCANVTVIQIAVADREGVAAFHVPGDNGSGRLVDRSDHWVPTTSLDTAIDAGTVPVPDFVKCDVEGAENRLLAGATKLLARKRTTWKMSLHLPGARDIFERAGYDVRDGEYGDIIATP
jgi:FkbM family methyltransferase